MEVLQQVLQKDAVVFFLIPTWHLLHASGIAVVLLFFETASSSWRKSSFHTPQQ